MPSVASARVEHYLLDHEHRLTTTKRIERSSSRALRYEQEEAERVYESYYRGPASGPAKSNQRRREAPQQQQATATTANATNGHGGVPIKMNGRPDSNPVSPQRVRLIETSRPASHFGPSSQRASRSSLSGGGNGTTRIGRFVNYYPASRQPSPSGRRQPNPYAFHVPSSYTLPAPTANQRDLHYYSSQYELVGAAREARAESQLSSEQLLLSSSSPPPPARQSSYGFVAPLDRVEGSTRLRQFNKSLRSRTISHLPSMVQVSILEDDTKTARRQESGASQRPTSSGSSDLLKAHVVVWRSDAQLEQDNPFRPGTELSWEAELMVRLIKRGYPIDQLPRLVEAAEVEAGARRRSSGDSSRDRPTRIPTNNSKSLSHINPAAAATWTPANKPKYNSIDSKAIWANSLKRAKSVPRFEASAKGDSDSIDRLIASIESDVLLSEQLTGRGDQVDANGGHASPVESVQSEKFISKSALPGKFQPLLGSSPIRTRKYKTNSTKERPQHPVQQVAAPEKPVRARQPAGQLMIGSDAKKQTEAKRTAVVKQKKRRCCTIH